MILASQKASANTAPVNALSLGLMSLGGAYGPAGDTAARLKVLDALYEAGIRTWDGADVYGDTEVLVGQWFEANPDKRHEVFMTTKCGILPDRTISSDPAYIKQACANSLAKLKTNYVDLLYIQRVDQKIPIEKIMQALSELKKEGKIRAIGLSEVSARTLQRACKIDQVDALQIEYSPFTLDIEKAEPGQKSVLDTCKELNITIFGYSPLGRGFLTGSIKSSADVQGDARSMYPVFAEEAFEKNMELVHAIGDITKNVQQRYKDASQAQVVLAWILRQWNGIIPLFGTRSAAKAQENMAAVDIKLTDDEIQAIRDAAESLKKVGDRYPGVFQHTLNADTPEL